MNNSFLNNNVIRRLRNAYNVFMDRDLVREQRQATGPAYSRPNHRPMLHYGNEKSIVGSVYNRIATDVSMVDIRHVRVDDNEMYEETIDSGLNRCLSLEANIDQTHIAFLSDIVQSMFDEGSVALVPIDTSVSLVNENVFDILTMRTGKILQWYPHHVRLQVYNDNRGEKEEIILDKSKVGILENPFYSVMNERNSIAQRLIAKLNLIDAIDEQSGSGKLDLIIQLPYVVKSEKRREQAEARRKDLTDQLKDNAYGVAYTDGTEKVIQLNRPAENNLMGQVEYLTSMLYSQLSVSQAILDGTADEAEQLNYQNRIITPIARSISSELKRKFLSKTAQSQGQTVMSFRDLFSMITPERLADLADKLTRNEVASPNDIRAIIGLKPSKSKGADELRNRNLNQQTEDPKPEDKNIDVTQEFNRVKQSKGE